VDNKKDKQIIIKVICVIASFVFWLYVANTKNPIRDKRITLKVVMENTDVIEKSKLAILPDEDFELSVRVEGPMLELSYLNEEDIVLKADFAQVNLSEGINRIPVYVSRIPKNIDIVDKDNLSIDVNLDDLIEKSVPVRENISVTTKSGYSASKPIITPQKVKVKGAEQYVQNVSYVLVATSLEKIDKDEELNLPLQPYDEAGREVKNVTVEPQTVNVVVPVKKTKKVAIKVETTGNVAYGGILKSVEAVPSTIEIAGDEKVLESINEIKTEVIDLTDISEDKTMEVKLVLDKVTTVSGKDSVNVKLAIEKLEQKNISVDINFINLAEGLKFQSDYKKVSFVVSGAETVIKKLKAEDIKCTVDLKDLLEGIYPPLQVRVTAPENVTIQSYSPETVEVTIEKIESDSERDPDPDSVGPDEIKRENTDDGA
jgi:YbbR domain-containing protein